MTEEIKEILDNLEYVSNIYKVHIEDGYKVAEEIPSSMAKELRLNSYSARTLLDYITNLQQENEKLKEEKEEYKECFNLMAKFRDKALERELIYKSRCEKASMLLNNIYLLNNVTITNNVVIEIDKAINILNGSDEK